MRKLLVSILELTDANRLAIETEAGRQGFEVRFFDTCEAALPYAGEAEIIFASFPALAKNSPNLRWFCTPWAGVDSLCRPGVFEDDSIILSNSSGAYGVTISEHIILMLLTLLRRQPEYNEIVSRRRWVRDLKIKSIFGSRVLMLGTGDIGRETAKRLWGFGPESITGVNRSGRAPDGIFDSVSPIGELDSLLPDADIAIMSLPGTAETYHILDERRLALLPDGAVIVNVGRGSAIDQPALVSELKAGRLRAALDVFEREPIPADDEIWSCPNLVITPHIAGNNTLTHTVDMIVEQFLEDFRRYCDGEIPLRYVDRNVGY